MKREYFFIFLKQCATLGPLGYLPASGTVATAVTIPAVFLVKWLVAPPVEFLIILLLTLLSGLIVTKVLQLLPMPRGYADAPRHHDPSQIVLDEVVGCFWAFYGVPLTWQNLVMGFLLFRFLDIVKPFGVDAMQRLPRAWGVFADDILAGMYTALLLFFIR